eukprot:TRINITY_DN18169_c0_g1_i1.p1 TRINITY_DN18169_c0_g1~~TRINITY_DN18169_c0_g1_i1.p1  ORF type:complete len:940 (+),score=181.73 TRINITY_DN18169_c0_g1_i1:351-3170(+)
MPGGQFAQQQHYPADHVPQREGARGLLTYKQFMLELEDDVSPTEAEKRYSAYKAEYIQERKQEYFELHKGEDWLREKYDPVPLEALMLRRNEAAKSAAKEFIAALEAGVYDVGPGLADKERTGDDLSADDDDDDGRFRKSRDRSSRSERDARSQQKAAPKVPFQASSAPQRVAHDLQQAWALVVKLDAEKGVTPSALLHGEPRMEKEGEEDGKMDAGDAATVAPQTLTIKTGSKAMEEEGEAQEEEKVLEGAEFLDVYLTYLWRVHGVDYYGARESQGGPPRGGLRTIRAGEKEDTEEEGEAAKGEKEKSEEGQVVLKRVDDRWQARIGPTGVDPLAALLGNGQVETAIAATMEAHVKKIKDEKYGWKYGCGAKDCTKLFHGPEFVMKHLKLKHKELAVEAVEKAKEEIYRNNYLRDTEAPMPEIATATAAPRNSVPQQRRDGDGPSRVRHLEGPGGPVPGRGGGYPFDGASIMMGAPGGGDRMDAGRLQRGEGDRYARGAGGGVGGRGGRYEISGGQEGSGMGMGGFPLEASGFAQDRFPASIETDRYDREMGDRARFDRLPPPPGRPIPTERLPPPPPMPLLDGAPALERERDLGSERGVMERDGERAHERPLVDRERDRERDLDRLDHPTRGGLAPHDGPGGDAFDRRPGLDSNGDVFDRGPAPPGVEDRYPRSAEEGVGTQPRFGGPRGGLPRGGGMDPEPFDGPERDLPPRGGDHLFPPPILGDRGLPLPVPFDYRGPFEGGPPRDGPPIFDPFNGPPPGRGGFGGEPPPMLIPVPGAGPLGPFVPAPPEIAMRMMRDRERGGPMPFYDDFDSGPPFDGPLPMGPGLSSYDSADGGADGHGARGDAGPGGEGRPRRSVRNRMGPGPDLGPGFEDVHMRGGPPGGMMMPLMPMPLGGPMGPMGMPMHRPDPRRVRSYKDLDAPEDEVTVIDYRSL